MSEFLLRTPGGCETVKRQRCKGSESRDQRSPHSPIPGRQRAPTLSVFSAHAQSDELDLICGPISTLQRKKKGGKKYTLGNDQELAEFTELNQPQPRSSSPRGCKLVRCKRTLQNFLPLTGNTKLAPGSGAGLSTRDYVRSNC